MKDKIKGLLNDFIKLGLGILLVGLVSICLNLCGESMTVGEQLGVIDEGIHPSGDKITLTVAVGIVFVLGVSLVAFYYWAFNSVHSVRWMIILNLFFATCLLVANICHYVYWHNDTLKNMETLRIAVQKYKESMGELPPTLKALAPDCMSDYQVKFILDVPKLKSLFPRYTLMPATPYTLRPTADGFEIQCPFWGIGSSEIILDSSGETSVQ